VYQAFFAWVRTNRKVSNMPKRVTLALLMGLAVAILVAGSPSLSGASDEATPKQSSTVHELLSRDLDGVPGKELRLLSVDYVPGGASLPHRHDAQVFVYVLEGSMRMQVEGSSVQLLGPGQTFYEGPDDIHSVSANASPTKPARILVFMVKEKGAPVSRPVAPKSQP
jgi:quercetin dioxygenase-like cupin family protein